MNYEVVLQDFATCELEESALNFFLGKGQILPCPPKFLETTSFTCFGFLECIFLPGFVGKTVGSLEKSHHLVDHSAVFDLYQYPYRIHV